MTVFSIIVPMYKVEKYIRQCINSILKQTFEDFELICVDDCGKDNSIKIVEQIAQKDKRIKIIHHDTNKGLSAARNSGIKIANGKFILFVDSDDWLEANCLTTIYNAFQNKQVDSIWFDSYKYWDNKGIRDAKPVLGNKGGFLSITPDNIHNCSDYAWIKAYKTKCIKEKNLTFPEGLTFEDCEFYFKYYTFFPNTFVLEDCLYNYRVRENSIVTQAQKGKGKIEDIFQIIYNLRDFYIKNNFYDKYKIAIMKLIRMRINTCSSILHSRKKALNLAHKILKDFNFPNDFKQFGTEKTPLISIIIPIYNVEKYIEECLKSVQAQTYCNLEIICIDDCGNDNSMALVKKIRQNDSRIKIIKHDKNKGLGGARNTGLNAAQGKYIFFVDSDDRLVPHCVETVLKKFQETQLNTVWYKANIWWENEQKMTDMFIFKYYADIPGGRYILDDKNLINFPLYTWNKAYNREFLIKNNLNWTENKYFEDVEFYFKTFITSPEIYIINEPLYIYRRRNDSIIGKCIDGTDKAADLYDVTTNVYQYLKQNNLFDKYSNAFYRYSIDALNMFRNFPDTYQKLCPRLKKFTEDITLNIK